MGPPDMAWRLRLPVLTGRHVMWDSAGGWLSLDGGRIGSCAGDVANAGGWEDLVIPLERRDAGGRCGAPKQRALLRAGSPVVDIRSRASADSPRSLSAHSSNRNGGY